MTPSKHLAFRISLTLFAAFAITGLYFAGVLQTLDLVGVAILAIAFGAVAIALYKAIRDDENIP